MVGMAIFALLLPSTIFSILTGTVAIRYFADLCFLLYATISLVYFCRAAYYTWRNRPELFKSWLLLTFSVAAILCAVGEWLYVDVLIGEQGDATTGAMFLFVSHLLLSLGIYCFPQNQQGKLCRARQIIDVLVIMIGCNLLLWAFWINPRLQQADLNVATMWETIVYLSSDVILMAALGSLFFRRQLMQPTAPIILLSLSVLVMLVADLLFTIQIDVDMYQSGGLVDHLDLAAIILGTVSAKLQIDAVRTPKRPVPIHKRLYPAIGALRTLLPPLLLFCTFVVMVVTHDTKSPYHFYIMAVGIGIMFILVSVHQIFTLMENVDLTSALRAELMERRQAQDELQQVNERLEHYVAERTRELLNVNQQLRENERKLRFDAFHDKLTGLPNRAAFIHHLEGALQAYGADPTYRFAVLFLDFDGFKIVNDSLGHWLGDEFLIALARRIKEQIPIGNFAARLGGDEFVILVENILTEQEAVAIANHLQSELRRSYEIRDYRLYTTASIGVVMNDDLHQTAGDLLRDADIAMYQAKESGKACCVLFDATMRTQAMARLRLETSLRNALTRAELQVAYQPIWDVATQCVTGFEALARWHHEEHGIVSPGEFIPIAEETGLIIPLGEWIMEEACRQLKQWHKRSCHALPLTVSVNISAKQLYQGNLITVVKRTLQRTELPANALKLEITESVFMEDIEAAIQTCSQLRDLGVHLQIDDFGTGYSSFNYLHRLPINTMKIDKSFIDLISLGGQHVEIVRTLATLAQSLQLSVIAEGVETEEQLQYVESLGCEQVQGYLISKPLDHVAAETFIGSSAADPDSPNHLLFSYLP